MKTLCPGSRRKVLAARHKLKISPNRHMAAECPVCKRTLAVRRLLGVVEFPRHAKKQLQKPAAKK
jgi:ribosomal protein L37AE/L43A